MLPVLDGIEACKEIRKFSPVPIIMLTAKDQEIDKVWRSSSAPTTTLPSRLRFTSFWRA